ncbi:MAG TPA: efflux RND transporter periplasmic adaptor subunit [Burkholderiales bacterium]|nr:efflux RND transporter periplasmic adaptor subunit [Burkholderiales bacterium]
MRRTLALIVLLIALAAGAIWYASRPDPLPVTVATVERGLVESTVANTRAGTVSACRRAKLAPRSGGQIARLHVQEGDRVRAGQVLLELWNEDLRAQLELARDQQESARERATEICLTADAAEREAQRSRQLMERGFISEERLDRAVSDAQARRAACNAARAEVKQAAARATAVEAELSRSYLRAPFAGVVAEVTGEVGEFTTPSPPGIPTPPAVDLIDDSCLYVTAPIDEVDAPNIVIGQPGRITIDAFPGKKFPGHVRRIAPYVLDREKQARTVDVEIEFEDASQFRTLLVGYSADVEIVLAARDNVLRVPTAALLEGNRVWLVTPEGRLTIRKLETGLSNWEFTEVRSGLSEGDRIVLSVERQGLVEGAKVIAEGDAGARK